jgi:transcriptional regulator with GAF, ATPase, and Fis domain
VRAGELPTVEDLGSSNGTRVRGARIAAHAPVRIGFDEFFEVGEATAVIQAGGGKPAEAAPGTFTPPSAEDLFLETIAKSAITVLVVGETGAGKEVAADRIHALSNRRKAPLVKINCAAMPEALLESELFGHERAAFTGAATAKVGLIEAAEGGTFFLDEVGELPLPTQAKLLRVLENGEILRVGALKPRIVDVRFVAATNRDLEAMVKNRTFREDLFHRLSGYVVRVPPLRERPAEISALARAFLTDACARASRSTLALSKAAVATLEAYPWPGNVRELKKVIEVAALLSHGEEVDLVHLPRATPAPPSSPASPTVIPPPAARIRDRVEHVERASILEALERSHGNQSEAAKLLGISRHALLRRLDAYQVPRPRKR